MTDRQISQVIAEVAENPTTVQRRVSQVVLEVSHSPGAAPAAVAGVGVVPEVNIGLPTISGLVFHLNAQDVGGADGDPVSTWPDRSGNAHNFTGTSTTRPLVKTNIAGPNSDKRAIQFDGSNDYLDGGDLQSVFPSAATLFIVYQPLSGDDQWALARNNGNDGWWCHSGAQGYMSMFRTSRVANYPTGVPTSGRHSYAIKSSSSTYQAYIDGVAKTAQTASYDNGDTYFYIGGGAPSDPQGQNRQLNGYIFEILAYDTALSSTDITALEVYAENYWGFGSTARPAVVAGIGSVPAATAYTNAGPNVVAGIAAVPAPTAIGGADGLAAPSTVAGVGAVPAPTAIGSTAGEATPNVVPGIGAVPAATASGPSTATPSVVVGMGAVPAPATTGPGVASPTTVAGVGVVQVPTVFAFSNPTALPAVVAGIGRVRAPFFPSGSGSGPPVSVVSSFWTIYLGPSDGGGA